MWLVRAKSRRSERVEWHEFASRDDASDFAARAYHRARWDVSLIYGRDCGQI